MKKKQNAIEMAIVAMAAIAVVIMVLACKHVYPFGSAAVTFQGDYLSQYLPFYYGVWDMLHGKALAEFDWNLSLGMGLAGGLSHFYARNPLMLLLLGIKRDAVPYVMALIYGGTVTIMATGMDLFLGSEGFLNQKKGNSCLRIVFSLAYAFSLHSIMYMGLGWPFTGMVVPFLLYYLNRMQVEPKKKSYYVGYVIALALIFIMNIPQAYAVCLFLVFYVGFVAYYKAGKGLELRNFIWASLIALALSMIFFLPSAINTFQSYRYQLFNEGGNFLHEYHHKIAAEGLEEYRKIQMLQWVGPVLAVTFLLAIFRIKYDQNRKKSVMVMIFDFLIALPLVVEVTNIMWNNGPYVCFPVRHGYLIYFSVITCFYYFATNYDNKLFLYLMALVFSLFTIVYSSYYIRMYIGTMTVNKEYVASTKDHSELSRYREKNKESTNGLDAIKNRVATLGNYYPLNTTEQIETNQRLGYNQVYVHLSDKGGTILSDLLFRIDGVVDDEGLIDSYQYKLPDVVFISEKNMNLARSFDGQGQFAEQNRISRMLFGVDLLSVYTEDDLSPNIVNQLTDDRCLIYVSEPNVHPEIQQIKLGDLKTISASAQIGILDTNELQKYLSEMKNNSCFERKRTTLTATIDSEETGFALIPVYAGKGWTYYVNEQKVDAVENAYNMMVLPVQKGQSVIYARWIEPGKMIGGVISICALIVFAIMLISKKYASISSIKLSVYEGTMKVALWIFMAYIYIVPMLYRGMRLLKGLVS